MRRQTNKSGAMAYATNPCLFGVIIDPPGVGIFNIPHVMYNAHNVSNEDRRELDELPFCHGSRPSRPPWIHHTAEKESMMPPQALFGISIAFSFAAWGIGPGGTDSFVARLLSGARIVMAFNTVYFEDLRKAINKDGERIGIPIASDDQEGLKAAIELAERAGFDPVVVGSLSKSKMFDVGTAVYATSVSAREIKQKLKLE